jgi:choline dehydrogenase-like flavoprotein
MYLNADQLPDSTLLQGFDLCIVGAGAAGLAMAKRLAGTSVKALVLSSGLPSDRGRPAAARQAIYRGTVGSFLQKVDAQFLERSRLHMHGGTTNHFGFWSRPLDEVDLRPRPGYRDARWPFGLHELAPYYRAAHDFGRFGPFNYDDMAFWERVLYARCFPPLPGDSLTGTIMHAQYEESLHDFQVQFDDELHAAPNVIVLFNANLLAVETTAGKDHVTGLACATIEESRAGRQFRVQAGVYVLAMGGIETVRVLKLSGDLGNNRSGHLGRGFMVHPLVTSAARVRFEHPIETEICNFFRDQQVRLQPPQTEGGEYTHISAPLVNPEDIFNYCVFNAWGVLVPKAETLDAEQIGNFRLILRFSPARDEAIVNVNWEQLPNENSAITLDPSQVDPIFGQPVSHLDWRLLDADKRTIMRALELCRAYLQARGAMNFELITDLSGSADHWSFAPDEGALSTGDHHMGALRMSTDSQNGIVNPDSRLHSVDNLYIAGCSVFPTGGFANPTLTIVALALRLADHLKMRLTATP